MPAHLPPDTGGDFTPPPAGTHMAVCYRVIDLGTQPGTFGGRPTFKRKVLVSWELPDEKMEDGEPFTVHQRYTWSSSEKAKLRQDLESWRGVPFKDSDFGPGGFEIKNILGAACLLTIVHEAKNGTTYANIRAVSKLPKGMKAPSPHNPAIFFDLDSYDAVVYGALSDGLRTIIAKSPEYIEATKPKGNGENHGEEPPPATAEDEYGASVPF